MNRIDLANYLFGEVVDVRRDFGAKGNISTPDDEAIQSAVDTVVAAGGGTIFFPPGTYRTTRPLIIDGQSVRLIGAGRGLVGADSGGSRIVNADSDVIHLGVTVNPNNFECRYMNLEAKGGGHVFRVRANIAGMCLDSLALLSHERFSIWDQSGTEYIDNLVLNCFLEHHPEATVPAWRFVGGSVNSNTWMRCRATSSREFFFHIESTSDGFHYDNAFRDINFEVTNGGCIKALGVNNLTIDNCNISDLSGPTTRDLFLFGPSSASPAADSINCVIRNSNRRGGDLGLELHDIKLTSRGSKGFIIENCGSTGGSPFSVDLAEASVLLIGGNPDRTTLAGGGNTTWLQRGRLMVDFPILVIGGGGSPEGVHTAPVGSIFLRRDGGSEATLYVKESGVGATGWVGK